MHRLQPAVRYLLFAVVLTFTQTATAIVTVGPVGSGCSYSKIQDAINYVLGKERSHPDDVDPYIAVAGDNFYNEALVIDSANVTGYVDPFGQIGAFVQIYGNYNQSCGDTPNGSTATVGAGGGKFGNSVLEIRGGNPVHVVLNHLILTDAGGAVSGGGINFHASAAGYLDLSNIDITGNHASYGGGIYANGHAPGLTLALHANTIIENNTASNDGGGILAVGETFFYATEGNLVVSNNTAGGAGGGIGFSGHGSVAMTGAQIVGNHGNEGGGIYVNADSPTDVNLDDGVFIALNTAGQDGGGIAIAGQAKLYAQSSVSPTQIFLNEVLSETGPGGGVYLQGPAQMRFSGSIASNTAGYGGGIALVAGQSQFSDDAIVTLTAPGSNTPVNVSGNTARRTGGAVFLKPYVNKDFFTRARLCATDFRFDLNQAQEGTAIYADEDFNSILGVDKIYVGSDVRLNDGEACNTRSICSAASGCNEINGNVAATADFQPTDGSTILIQTEGLLSAHRVELQQNEGGHAIRVVDDNDDSRSKFSISMDDCLITDNQMTQELLYLDNDLQLFNCTLAHNAIGGQHVIRVAGDIVRLTKSIIDQSLDTLDFAGNGNVTRRTLQFLLTNHADPTLGSSPTLIVAAPRFANVAQFDYHLRPDSPGLDATVADSLASDLDGYTRDVDLPLVPNYFQSPTNQGARDLGAYELQLFQLPPPPACARNDTVFCSTFE